MDAVSTVGKVMVANTSFRVNKSLLREWVSGGKAIDQGFAWVQLNRILQNIPGKGIATMLGTIDTKDVLVKVQLADEARAEYDIQERIKAARLRGFVHYTCMFMCDGDKDYITRFGEVQLNSAVPVCRGKGENMGVILMPFYQNESFWKFLTNHKKDGTIDSKKPEIIRITTTVLSYIYDAFTTANFLHGDLYPKNVVLDNDNNPVIIDYERSRFDDESDQRVLTKFWQDIDGFLNDISYYIFGLEFSRIVREHVMMSSAYNKDPRTDPSLKTKLIASLKNLLPRRGGKRRVHKKKAIGRKKHNI